MTLTEILPLLDHPRKSGKGWLARCPAHGDRSPSLSLREGEKAILLKCWSGCSRKEICSALAIKERNLFYGGLNSRDQKEAIRAGRRRQEIKALFQYFEFKKADILREAEAVIQAATGIDDSTWSVETRNRIMEKVSEAVQIEISEKGASFYAE